MVFWEKFPAIDAAIGDGTVSLGFLASLTVGMPLCMSRGLPSPLPSS